MTFTDGLSFSAVGIALIALIWNIIRDLNDKGNLFLNVNLGKVIKTAHNKTYIFSGPDVEKQPGPFVLAIFITNTGKRPVLVNKWYITSGSKKEKGIDVVIPYDLPRKLNETETHSEISTDFKKIKYPIRSIVVVDSTGKEWKVEKIQLDKINRSFKKYQQLKLI